MREYLKVRTPRRLELVRVVARDGDFLFGYAVNKGGDDIERETKTTIVKRLLVFRTAEIVATMKMNLHYAELE